MRKYEGVAKERKEKVFYSEMVKEFFGAMNVSELTSLIVKKSKELFKVKTCSLMLINKDENYLYIVSASGLPQHIIEKSKVKIGQGISGWVAREGSPLLAKDIRNGLPVKTNIRKRYQTFSFLSFPLKVGDETIGVINLSDKDNQQAFCENDIKIATQYFKKTGIPMIIERNKLIEEKEEEKRNLKEAYHKIDSLNGLSFKLSQSHLIEEMIEIINEGFFSIFPLQLCAILLAFNKEKKFSLLSTSPLVDEYITKIKTHLKKKMSLFLPEIDLDFERFEVILQEKIEKEEEICNLACSLNLPLITAEQTIGMISILKENSQPFDRNELKVFSTITNHATSSLMRAELFKEIKEMADHDGLTGVLNHRAFYERFYQERERAKRFKEELSLLFFDMDDFKKINDKYNHLVGDEVLLKFSLLMKRLSRNMDIIARYGGEEFCIILPRTGKKEAGEIAERIRLAVAREEFIAKDKGVRLTVSCGVVSFPQEGEDLEYLIKTADQRMYTAKQRGKNQVCVN